MATEAPKLVIDCDAGIDDAQGIIIALSHNVEVLGITCTFGNVNVDQVSKNVLKILEVCERTDVPVFKGCNRPILGAVFDKPVYHGNDGLGDAANRKEPDMSLLKPTHAVEALVQLVSENPGQVVIVALGPLTNIALACRMDPAFPGKVKSIFLMGGSIHGKGNHWVSAEFNFGADPEAAYIVLNEFKSPISIMPWEACLDHAIEWDFYFQYVGQGTKRAEFLKIISSKIKEHEGGGPFITCDPFAICAAINPQIVLQEKLVHASVELHGHLTRGQMVVDWRSVLRKECNVRVLEKLNLDLFKKMMLQSVE